MAHIVTSYIRQLAASFGEDKGFFFGDGLSEDEVISKKVMAPQKQQPVFGVEEHDLVGRPASAGHRTLCWASRRLKPPSNPLHMNEQDEA